MTSYQLLDYLRSNTATYRSVSLLIYSVLILRGPVRYFYGLVIGGEMQQKTAVSVLKIVAENHSVAVHDEKYRKKLICLK